MLMLSHLHFPHFEIRSTHTKTKQKENIFKKNINDGRLISKFRFYFNNESVSLHKNVIIDKDGDVEVRRKPK